MNQVEERSEVRLVPVSGEGVEHLRWLSETARRLSVDPKTKNPAKFKADSELAASLAASYENGITTEEGKALRNFAKNYGPRSSFPDWWDALHDKLRAAFTKEEDSE